MAKPTTLRRGQDYTSKPQPTLKGFFAWAFDQYVMADGKAPGPTAEAMIEAHLRTRTTELEQEYGITRERFRRETGGNVTSFPSSGEGA